MAGGHGTTIRRVRCTWRLLYARSRVSRSLAIPVAARAQGGYFGRNKVQYRKFEFKVLKTEHFDIYFYPEEESRGADDRRGWPSAGTPACRSC